MLINQLYSFCLNSPHCYSSHVKGQHIRLNITYKPDSILILVHLTSFTLVGPLS